MQKKAVGLAVSALLALSICACGASGGEQSASSAQQTNETATTATQDSNEPQTKEYDPAVGSIDLTLEGGSIRYNHFEKANAELTDSDNVLIFVFDFTNEQSVPAQVQSVFRIQFFQNGAELRNNLSYSSAGGDQYELVGAFFNNAMKGGTVTFGTLVEPKDDSPITVMVSPNGAALEDNYQTMEVSINGEGGASEASSSTATVSTEEIDSALQGTWEMGDQGIWTFDQGSLTFTIPDGIMSGTYEVDADASTIVCHLEATDGTVNAYLPYAYENGTLHVFKNSDKAEEMTRM